MTSFCQQLEDKGFTKIGSDNNITRFVGDFTGRQAYVEVGATEDGKNVYSVVVLFESSGEWNTLVSTYDYYKFILESMEIHLQVPKRILVMIIVIHH